MLWIRALWDKLITPHPRIEDEEERINSRLLSVLLLSILPVAFLFLVILAISYYPETSLNTDFKVFGSLIVVFWGVYWVNRRGYFRLANLAILLIGGISITAEAILDSDFNDLAFLLLPMIIASLFLPRDYLLFISLINISGPVAILLIFPPSETDNIIRFILPMLVVGTILIIISRTHRDFLEESRNQKLKASELRYTLLTEAVNDGLWDWDLLTNSVYYSPRWKSMIGYEPGEISDSPEEWRARIHPEDLEHVVLELEHLSTSKEPSFKVDYRFKHKKGHYIWVMSRGIPIYDDNNTLIRTVGSHTDITDRKQAEQELEHNALHDLLTGLANRYLFNEKVEHSIKFARKNPNYRFAVLFLDMDNFKDVNDSMGHDAGDELLKQFASRLESSLFDLDTVARLGGDEFVILLEGLDDVQRPIGIVQRIKKTIEKPFTINETEIVLTVSIGIVIGTSRYSTAEEVLRDADIAMYHAKNAGRNTFEIFNPSMREQILDRLNLERELRMALYNEEFHLEYQPITDLNSNQLLGFEALIRWQHPERGLVSPRDFIPIAEQSGLIVPIGNWVFKTACSQLSEWDEKFPALGHLTMNVNISEKQITHSNFFSSVCKILELSKLEPARINLEITENVVLQSDPEIREILINLVELGVNLQLDDFGTGQSSLGYLRRFPLSTIKIDQSFTNHLDETQDLDLIRGIIQLARALKLKTVAEGIETRKQASTLRALQCDQGQGFGISKPEFAQEIEKMLINQAGNPNLILPATDFQA
jgi:diguanylate cyclase (GGDEF)-like protein/PAS domain S-box-containing protein